MHWETQLITIYVNICDSWNKEIINVSMRISNNSSPAITDQEIITIYIFGLFKGLDNLKKIYSYAHDHLKKEFFKTLGNYKSFVARINRLSDVFCLISQSLIDKKELGFNDHQKIIDSLPIILASAKRSSNAKVANDLADKGFCASKNMYFYGVKLHCLNSVQEGSIPFPSFAGLAPASFNDNFMFKQVSQNINNCRVFADKAYCDEGHKTLLKTQQNVELITPYKSLKGYKDFEGSNAYSTWVSTWRQPIESFFNWLIQKTDIQNASKVRSSAGLKSHVFGRFLTAVFIMSFF